MFALIPFSFKLFGFSCRYFSSPTVPYSHSQVLKWAIFCFLQVFAYVFPSAWNNLSLFAWLTLPPVPSAERAFHLGNLPRSLSNSGNELDAPCYRYNTWYIRFSWHLQNTANACLFIYLSAKSYLRSGAMYLFNTLSLMPCSVLGTQ